jgi:DNA-binding LacI/PurR family transcriptional regulator
LLESVTATAIRNRFHTNLAATVRRASSEQKVRLRDVARAAGVSTASASRALNFPEAVGEALRTRITTAAKRLGYLPNPAARALATRRSRFIGVLIESLADPLTAALLDALEKTLRREGFGVALGMADHPRDSLANVGELLGRGVDAVLSWEGTASAEAASMVAAHGKPWLDLNNAAGDAIGRGAGASLACRYLLSLGHERIGVVLGSHRRIEVAIPQNLAGTAGELLIPEVGTSPDASADLQRACAILMDRSERPTAIACASDLDALAVLRECRVRGIEVPGDVSIVGFGDTELARRTWPSLTSSRVAIAELAARAVATLVAMLAGQTGAISEPSVKLVVRESTALAPG